MNMDMEQKLTLDDTVDFFKNSQDFLFKLRKDHHTAERNIESKLPIVLLLAGDLHLGSVHTDYDAFREMVVFVKETPGAYVIFNGDLVDNFDSLSGKLIKAGIDSQLVPPAAQRDVYDALIDELGDRILSVTIGNHEEFSVIDGFLNAGRRNKVPIGLNRITLNLKVNNSWGIKIAVIHKADGYSHINPNHANRREQHAHYPDADVVVVGHTHTPAIQTLSHPKDGELREVIFVQTGSFKSADAYTYKHFTPHVSSRFAVHGLVLMPDSSTIQPAFGLSNVRTVFNRLWIERYKWHKEDEERMLASGRAVRMPDGRVLWTGRRMDEVLE